MAASLTSAQLDELDAALRNNDMMLAVRTYRAFTGSTISQAGEFLQERARVLQGDQLPDIVRSYLASAHARQGELVAWWRDRTGSPCTLVLFQRTPQPAFEVSLLEGPMFGHQAHSYTCALDAVLAAADRPTGFHGAEWDGTGAFVAAKIRSFAAELVTAPPRADSSRATTLHLLDAEEFERDFLFLPGTVDAGWWARARNAAQTSAEVSDALDELDGDSAKLPPQAGRLVLALCVGACSRRSARTGSTAQFFADLESSPPNWRSLPPDAMIAWEHFLALGGVSGPPRVDLPWWLSSVRQCGGRNAGLLPPPQARLVARHGASLAALFGGGGDASALLDLVRDAAREGAWVLGIEPQG
ncbi:MAG: hypothetical protein SF028_03350 [Candidatus Sumerlaeia bacterium]|nr:hypothetical protein [Candidatus Sumerlaeia bacterium]